MWTFPFWNFNRLSMDLWHIITFSGFCFFMDSIVLLRLPCKILYCTNSFPVFFQFYSLLPSGSGSTAPRLAARGRCLHVEHKRAAPGRSIEGLAPVDLWQWLAGGNCACALLCWCLLLSESVWQWLGLCGLGVRIFQRSSEGACAYIWGRDGCPAVLGTDLILVGHCLFGHIGYLNKETWVPDIMSGFCLRKKMPGFQHMTTKGIEDRIFGLFGFGLRSWFFCLCLSMSIILHPFDFTGCASSLVVVEI